MLTIADQSPSQSYASVISTAYLTPRLSQLIVFRIDAGRGTLAEIMADGGHYSIDSTTVRAHVSAAGGKGGLIDVLLAARGGGFTSKLHCLADARGRPIAFQLTVGEAADCKAYDVLIGLPE